MSAIRSDTRDLRGAELGLLVMGGIGKNGGTRLQESDYRARALISTSATEETLIGCTRTECMPKLPSDN